MRFVSFQTGNKTSWGRVDGEDIIDLDALAPDLKTAISVGLLGDMNDGPRVARNTVKLLPVVPNPSKILCVGHNYEEHRVETGRDATEHPSIFTRFADTLVGADFPIVLPTVSSSLDYEAELAVVIGKGGRNISEADALNHIAGYSCFNDASLRDWQWHTRQFIPGKNFPGTGVFGPELVTPDELTDMDSIRVESYLNGIRMQSATLDHMLFPIATIIAYVSAFTQLSPGDVIATGTPGGVGAKRNPPVWMKAGDQIEVRISGVGSLNSHVVSEDAA